MKAFLPTSFLAKAFLIFTLLGFTTSIEAADHNIWPERVTDFAAQWDSSTGYVTVTLTAPTNSMTSMGSGNGEPLPYLTKVVISRNLNYGEYIEVHTFENPEPGEQLTYVDTTVGEGLYQYKAVAYIDDYASYPEWCEIEIGQKPVDIYGAYATCNKGKAPVTIYFNAPSLDTHGEPLNAIEKIEVSRYSYDTYAYEVIGMIANPAPAAACSYEDYDVVSGESYSYRLVVYTTAGNSYGTVVNVMVGLDSPVAPTNVVAREVNNGVSISWDAPHTGQTNGYIDVNELKYKVLRSATGSEYEAVVVAEAIEQLSYFDMENFEKEVKYIYFVRAFNEQGESIGAPSNEVVVGPPSVLPFIETFDSKTSYEVSTTDHQGWTYASSETACAWYINDVVELEDRNITTESGRGGMAFAMYGSYNDLQQDDYMTSGKISLAGAHEPLLKFRYYTFTGCNSTLAVEISIEGDDYEQVGLIEYQGRPQEDWESFVMSLSDYNYKNAEYIQVRLHAHKGTYACPVIIDNFVISDLSPVENITCDYETGLLTWSAPESPYLELTGYAVGVNGTWMPELPATATQYDFSKFKNEYFLMMGVYAIYEGSYYSVVAEVDLTSVDEIDAAQLRVAVSNGVLSVIAQDNVAIEIYNIEGQLLMTADASLSATLPSGIYIVKCGDIVRKVAVK